MKTKIKTVEPNAKKMAMTILRDLIDSSISTMSAKDIRTELRLALSMLRRDN